MQEYKALFENSVTKIIDLSQILKGFSVRGMHHTSEKKGRKFFENLCS